jgi:hypothetical protein
MREQVHAHNLERWSERFLAELAPETTLAEHTKQALRV